MAEDPSKPTPVRAGIFSLGDRSAVDDATIQGDSALDSGETLLAGAPHEQDLIYDSMEAQLGIQDEVIELVDINAALRTEATTRPSPYPLAVSTPLPEAGPAFDGVIDGSVTQADGGRALLLARHPARPNVPVPVGEMPAPEVPPERFGPSAIAFSAPNSPAVSQFRLLKIRVENFIDQNRYRSIAITSTRAGEGRTTTALNLAIVMSENPWLKIALVDLNFRKPDLGRIMRVPDGDPGLLHVLSGRATLDAALHKVEHRNLYLLHTGGIYDGSMSILNSAQFDVFLSRLCDAFDLVIVDAPPVVGQDDALVIKQKVDGVFMVLQAQATPLAEMQKAVARLGRERLLGVVLNRVHPREMP